VRARDGVAHKAARGKTAAYAAGHAALGLASCCGKAARSEATYNLVKLIGGLA